MLCVFSVLKVRSLQFQMGSSQRKRKLGKGLFTDKAETEEVGHMIVIPTSRSSTRS